MRGFLIATVQVALLAGMLSTAGMASADVGDVDVDLSSALDLPSGVSLDTDSTAGGMLGVTTRAFNDFPRAGAGSYAVMSTGRATDLFNLDLPGRQPSTNFGGAPDRASISLTVPSGARTVSGETARCLLVDVSMGTEERVHYATENVPGDYLSVTLNGSSAEYAKHVGPRWFAQQTAAMAPVAYTVNAIKYWHGIDQEFERQPDDASAPLLAGVTPFDQFTSVDTLEVPLNANGDATDDVVTVSVQDVNNNSLDTVMLMDRVRLAPHCSNEQGAETGLFASRNFEIVGHRGVNNTLTIDLIPETDVIERYDSADNGWFPAGGVDLRFRWYRSMGSCTTSDMRQWEPIHDADRQSFTPKIAEKGKCILALVTGLKDGYRSETFPSPGATEWRATLPIQDGVFTSVEAPSISNESGGDAVRVNDVLAANHGVFTPRPDSYKYEWLADGSTISGESGRTYKVTPSQAGKRIRVRVTASRLNFVNLPALSGETNPVDLLNLESTPVPTISGSGRALDELSVVPGVWQPDPVALSYQWFVDGAVIAGATSPTYRTTPTQSGKAISVHVTGRKAGYVPVTRQSAPISITDRAFITAPTPQIQGTGLAGDSLTVVPGTWDPIVTPKYEWFADNVAISGAGGSSYRPTEAQQGQQIHVIATGSLPGYTTTSRQSLPITVSLRELVGPKPEIIGDPYVGTQVRVDAGTWNPSHATLKFRWLEDGTPIKGATDRYFMLTQAQAGKHVTVEVTATLTNYEKVVVESFPIVPQIRSFMTQAPRISGTPKVGSAVTAQQGGWLPTPSSTKYEWYIGNQSLGTGSYLMIPPAAAGQRLRLVMTGTRQHYTTATATATSGVVARATLTSSAPTIGGTARPGKVLRINRGFWGPSPVTLRYQWYVGTKAIARATRSSYKVPKKYRNKKIRVRVTGSKVGYTTVSRYSSYVKIAKK